MLTRAGSQIAPENEEKKPRPNCKGKSVNFRSRLSIEGVKNILAPTDQPMAASNEPNAIDAPLNIEDTAHLLSKLQHIKQKHKDSLHDWKVKTGHCERDEMNAFRRMSRRQSSFKKCASIIQSMNRDSGRKKSSAVSTPFSRDTLRKKSSAASIPFSRDSVRKKSSVSQVPRKTVYGQLSARVGESEVGRRTSRMGQVVHKRLSAVGRIS